MYVVESHLSFFHFYSPVNNWMHPCWVVPTFQKMMRLAVSQFFVKFHRASCTINQVAFELDKKNCVMYIYQKLNRWLLRFYYVCNDQIRINFLLSIKCRLKWLDFSHLYPCLFPRNLTLFCLKFERFLMIFGWNWLFWAEIWPFLFRNLTAFELKLAVFAWNSTFLSWNFAKKSGNPGPWFFWSFSFCSISRIELEKQGRNGVTKRLKSSHFQMQSIKYMLAFTITFFSLNSKSGRVLFFFTDYFVPINFVRCKE